MCFMSIMYVVFKHFKYVYSDRFDNEKKSLIDSLFFYYC